MREREREVTQENKAEGLASRVSISAKKVSALERIKDWEGSGRRSRRTSVPAQKPQEHHIMAVQLMPESAVCLLMVSSKLTHVRHSVV